MSRVAAGLATLVVGVGAAQAATLIHAGRVIDGVSDSVKTNQTVVIDGGKIIAIEAGFRAPGQGDRVADLRDLDLDDRTGSIAIGKLGELVGVPGDPLKDIPVMERVVFVMKDNTVYKAP
jgi:imidazolonepropionase-like amidohydrolase